VRKNKNKNVQILVRKELTELAKYLYLIK